MAGYDRDEYEDYDDYDMEGEEGYEEGYEEEEEEEAKEEDHKPTEEEMEYLELRQRLKESIRQKRKESGSLLNGREKEKKPPYDNYGSFFGPSQPVIAQRVIQESKSLLENKQLVSRMLESKNSKKLNPASNSSGSKLGVNDRPPKISELKKKVEKLKMARDYSFLSDDAELPVPAKEPPRSISVPNSEARPAHMPLKSKQPLGNGSRNVQGVREERKSVSLNGHLHPKAGSYKPTSAVKPNLTSIDSKKQLSVNNGIGPGRPAGAKALPSKMPVAAMEKKILAPGAKNPPPNMQKAPSSKMQLSNSKQAGEQKKGSQEHANSGILSKKPVPPSMSKQAASSLMSKRPASSSMLKRPAPSSMSIQSSVSSSKSRPQMNKPLKQVSSHASSQFQKPKKKPLSEDEKALSMIRRMFNTPRFLGRDDGDYDDDDCDIMEASFDEIMKEEKRSAKIARREDEEQQRLIEEEERRERMRRLAKKQKLSH